MREEQWRTCARFPDYRVSDHGRVKSMRGRIMALARDVVLALAPPAELGWAEAQDPSTNAKRRVAVYSGAVVRGVLV